MHKSIQNILDRETRRQRILREAMEEMRREDEQRQEAEEERRHNASLRWPR
jgi:hypothetical protein